MKKCLIAYFVCYCLLKKPKKFYKFCKIFLVHSTKLENYVGFITASPKDLHTAGFVFVLVPLQGLHFVLIKIKLVDMRPTREL